MNGYKRCDIYVCVYVYIYIYIYIYTYRHTSICNGMLAIRKNEIMPFTAIWVDQEITILSEISHKDKYHMISLLCRI